MITGQQIRAARLIRRLTQAQLAHKAGISRVTLNLIEGGGDCLRSTAAALQEALAAENMVFRGGHVFERMPWAGGRPNDPDLRARVVMLMNASRKARGEPLFIDLGDDDG